MDTEKRGPGRPKKRERRRKGSVGGDALKLAVNEAMVDRNRFAYRWINDRDARVNNMTVNDDWDLVQDPAKQVSETGTDLGSAVSKVVGTDAHGAPIRAYLVRKPRAYHEADRAEKQKLVDKAEEALKSPNVENSYGEVRVGR